MKNLPVIIFIIISTVLYGQSPDLKTDTVEMYLQKIEELNRKIVETEKLIEANTQAMKEAKEDKKDAVQDMHFLEQTKLAYQQMQNSLYTSAFSSFLVILTIVVTLYNTNKTIKANSTNLDKQLSIQKESLDRQLTFQLKTTVEKEWIETMRKNVAETLSLGSRVWLQRILWKIAGKELISAEQIVWQRMK